MKTLFHVVVLSALALAFTAEAQETPVAFPSVIECRFTADQRIGVKFEPVEGQPGKVRITTFNEGENSVVPIATFADFHDKYSEQLMYVKWYERFGEFGLYNEYMIGRFMEGGRKFNPGTMFATEAMYEKNAEGAEVEQLAPIGRQSMRCQQGFAF